jgi:hypothetical protein
LQAVPACESSIQGRISEWGNSVFAQTFGQCRGESAIEFFLSEKSFNGGSGSHNITSVGSTEVLPFRQLSFNFRHYSE